MPETVTTDLDGDGNVDVVDLLQLIASFGPCPGVFCLWDVNGDGMVNSQDAAAVATHFRLCP